MRNRETKLLWFVSILAYLPGVIRDNILLIGVGSALFFLTMLEIGFSFLEKFREQ